MSDTIWADGDATKRPASAVAKPLISGCAAPGDYVSGMAERHRQSWSGLALTEFGWS